jgi:hypothetical protein
MLIVVGLVLFPFAKEKRGMPAKAPLPAPILKAQSIFLVNAGGNDPYIKEGRGPELAFDTIYKLFETWGRFKIADCPGSADLLVEVSYSSENRRTQVWGPTTGGVMSRTVHDPTIRVNIRDTQTGGLLWSQSIERREARTQRNRVKNLVVAARQLFNAFKKRVEGL